jgi:cobalt-zinc-cadmium efflux system outer membrane protein
MTHRASAFVVASLAAAWTVSPLAAQQPRITIHEAVARALEHHPSITAASHALDGARAEVSESAGARWPQLRLDAAATRFQEPMVVAPLHGFDPQSPPLFDRTLVQFTLGASYTLFDGGRRGALVRRDEAAVMLREADVDATTQALIAEVVHAWLAVSAGRALLAADDDQLGALRAEFDRVQQFLAVGRAAPVEGLRVEAALAQAEAARVAREVELARTEELLARLTGIPVETVRATTLAASQVSGPMPPLDGLRAQVRAGNADLARAQSRVRAADAMAAAAGSSWWPELRLQAGYTDYSSGEGRLTGEWQAGVRAGYALFTGGSRRAASARAGSERHAAEAEVAAIALRLDEAVDRVVAMGRSAEARSTALAAAARQYEEVARIERLALDEGAGTQPDWLSAQAALRTARSALIEARHAEVAAHVELARLTGRLSPATLLTLVEIAP